MRFAVMACVLAVVSLGCDRQSTSQSVAPGASEGGDEAEAGAEGAEEAEAEEAGAEPHAIIGQELPPELLGELRMQGDEGGEGRLLTLAPSFVATAACLDCGAPSYLRILAVRCVDVMHCEVLSEECEGSIAREAERYELDFRAVEGAPEGGAEVCAAYSGSFEMP